jgi:hypothetical protein
VTLAAADGGEWIGAVDAGRVLGVDRKTIFNMPREILPYLEQPTTGRGPTRRYKREDVEALKAARDAGVSLPGRVAELEQRVAELERWRERHERRPPVE